MGNVLVKETAENIRYTEFENNQVLTADQLNDLFRYLDIQSRLTRTRGIGVGIICGLETGVTEENKIMVSMGSAITTDGDLLHFGQDQVFDEFIKFEDSNSKYDYFHNETGVQIPLFQLVNSKGPGGSSGKKLSQFAAEAGAPLKDFTGILYLEDYNRDADLCTGQDCDNRGIECVKDLKVLLAHKDQLAELRKSIPVMNRNYFSLEDVDVPRVMLKKTIKKYDELKGAFSSALHVQQSLADSLEKAFEVCKTFVTDDLNGDNPPAKWKELLEAQFKNQNPDYIEYLYDYLKDLCYAYNELRESLFNDGSICCPPVELFPKHILMGNIKNATVKTPLFTPTVPGVLIPSHLLLSLRRSIRFDTGETIRRFKPVSIEEENRHSFYASPVLRNKDEQTERIIFCFKRMDVLIRNFKVPEKAEIQNAGNIRIIPSYHEDRKLGERAIPFYYKYDPTLPVNAYWSFDDNVRRKENNIRYYFSSRYGLNKNFLLQSILPYSFFRIEGHIGFKYQEVERALNSIIDENNLPINLVTLQIEDDVEKVPVRPWHFPELHIYEHFVRQSFQDHLEQIEAVHTGLNNSLDERIRTATAADEIESFRKKKSGIDDSVLNFANAKRAVMAHKPVTLLNKEEDIEKFKTDVSSVISATTEVKRQTKDFGFSNTAIPHDFVINTDILRKSDLLADFLKQKISKKKEGLILNNFLKQNPGLEHAGGVVSGGTFVIVYTSNDDTVVADFMLPYASIDNEIVADPPKPTPRIPDIKIPPKFNPKIIDIDPPYIKALDKRIGGIKTQVELFDKNIKGFDLTLNGFNDKFRGLDEKVSVVDLKTVITRPVTPPGGTVTPAFDFDSKFTEFTNRLKDHETKFTRLGTDIDSVNDKLKDHDVKFVTFNNQFSVSNTKLGDLGTRIQGVETKVNGQDARFTEITGRLGAVDNKLNATDTRFTEFNNKIGVLDNRLGANEGRMGAINNQVTTIEGKLNNQVANINTLSGKMNNIETKVNTHDTKFNEVNTRITGLGGFRPPIR
jgi:predicted  nucleic acid-binding Zn-ribbon protein